MKTNKLYLWLICAACVSVQTINTQLKGQTLSGDPILVTSEPILITEDPILTTEDPILITTDPILTPDDTTVISTDDSIVLRGQQTVTEIGDPTGATVTRIHVDEWRVNGTYKVVGPVEMVVDGDITMGNNNVYIASNANLTVYIGGNITVAGSGGFNNRGKPENLIVMGTHPERTIEQGPEYDITLSGNGLITAVVYVPNARYITNGGGSSGYTSGSVVALEAAFNGTPGPFHFDEALRELDLGFLGYELSRYTLMSTGDETASEMGEEVFGASNYRELFRTLFQNGTYATR